MCMCVEVYAYGVCVCVCLYCVYVTTKFRPFVNVPLLPKGFIESYPLSVEGCLCAEERII